MTPSRHDVDDSITAATLDLLRSRGPRAVTIEAVTARSGVAKTTIYRRHRDRREMLTAAMTAMATPQPPGADAAPADRLRWVITHAVDAIDDGIGFGGLAALLTDEDAEFADVFRSILATQRAELEKVIDAGRADGSFRADVDPVALVDAMVGAYVAERARTGQVADDWQNRLFDLFAPLVVR